MCWTQIWFLMLYFVRWYAVSLIRERCCLWFSFSQICCVLRLNSKNTMMRLTCLTNCSLGKFLLTLHLYYCDSLLIPYAIWIVFGVWLAIEGTLFERGYNKLCRDIQQSRRRALLRKMLDEVVGWWGTVWAKWIY